MANESVAAGYARGGRGSPAVTAISGLAQLVQRSRRRGPLDDARLDRPLKQIGDTSVRLATRTEDVLDVSRLQAGQFDLRMAPTDVVAFVADVVDRTRTRTRALAGRPGRHPIHFRPALEQAEIAIDPARMEQVWVNLSSNAVKYSPEGGVIDVALDERDGGVQLDVKDTGIGLPPKAKDAIFEPFGRGSNALDRHIGGLGRGLYICRQIVQRHGGRIWATSEGDGAGTTMRVWRPHG